MISGEARVGGYLLGISRNILESCWNHDVFMIGIITMKQKKAHHGKLHIVHFCSLQGRKIFDGGPNPANQLRLAVSPIFFGGLIHPWWFCWPDV